jgi:hypothetical protein
VSDEDLLHRSVADAQQRRDLAQAHPGHDRLSYELVAFRCCGRQLLSRLVPARAGVSESFLERACSASSVTRIATCMAPVGADGDLLDHQPESPPRHRWRDVCEISETRPRRW